MRHEIYVVMPLAARVRRAGPTFRAAPQFLYAQTSHHLRAGTAIGA
jgi:hypothetical protein